MALHLFDGFTNTWTAAVPADTREFGTRWSCVVDGQVPQLGWFVPATWTGGHPSFLRLWDVGTTSVVASVAISSYVAGGWNWYTLSAPVIVGAGREYRVSAIEPSGSVFVEASVSPAAAPPSGLLMGASTRAYTSAGTTGFPNLTDNAWYEAIDVAFEPGTTPPTNPATPGDVDNLLADWLINTGDNTHQSDGLPWQINTKATALQSVVGSTSGQLDATKAVSDAVHDLLTATNKNLGTLWDLAGHLTDLELAAYKALFGAGAARLTGPNSAGGSAFYTADGNLVSQLVAETWQRVRVLRGDIGFGTDGWSMTAESDFEDAISFAEPADAYTLHITSYQPTQPANTSPAGLWLPRIGWWCIITGAHASQRQFVDFEQQLLSDQGHRMPGAAIQLKPGTLATVQAWVLA